MHSRQIRLIMITTVLFLFLAAGQLLAWEKPTTLNREEIPDKYKWNFNDMYPNWEAWESDLQKFKELTEQFPGYQGTLANGPDILLNSLLAQEEMGLLGYKLYRYPALMQAADSRDNSISARLQQIQQAYARFGMVSSWYNPEMLQIPWETMSKWLKETPGLAPHQYDIINLYRQQEHVLDADKEKLLSYFSIFNGTPLASYSELSTSDINFPTVTLSNGEQAVMTPGNYRNVLSTNRNQADRALAFKNYYGVYDENINTYAAMYNGIIQRDWANARARNYGSCLESYLDGDSVPVEIYLNLIETAKKGNAPVIRYFELRKKVLGLEHYYNYDGGIPIVDFNKPYDYDEAVQYVLDCTRPLGKEYQKEMAQVFKGRWVDVYENEGKTSGAFSAGVYGVHPYILMNYSDNLEDVFTLVHEAGHSVHSMLSAKNQPFVNHNPVIFIAEVASTLNEALLLDYMLERSNDPREKIMLLQQAIDNIIGTFYNQAFFADFEMRTHQLAEQGQPITADVLNNLYKSMSSEYFGNISEKDSLYSIAWARISHFYEAPFYVYKYATCFASSAKIYNEIKSSDKKISKKALEDYLALLKSGSSDFPMQLLRNAGVDLAQPETMRAVVDQLDGLVTQLEEELKKI